MDTMPTAKLHLFQNPNKLTIPTVPAAELWYTGLSLPPCLSATRTLDPTRVAGTVRVVRMSYG